MPVEIVEVELRNARTRQDHHRAQTLVDGSKDSPTPDDRRSEGDTSSPRKAFETRLADEHLDHVERLGIRGTAWLVTRCLISHCNEAVIR